MSAKNEKQNKNRGWRSGKKGKGGERKKETHLIAGENFGRFVRTAACGLGGKPKKVGQPNVWKKD
jgi:hypothetical protein